MDLNSVDLNQLSLQVGGGRRRPDPGRDPRLSLAHRPQWRSPPRQPQQRQLQVGFKADGQFFTLSDLFILRLFENPKP